MAYFFFHDKYGILMLAATEVPRSLPLEASLSDLMCSTAEKQ